MSDLFDPKKNPQAAQLLHDQKKLEQLRDAPETQQLFRLLSQKGGGDLKQAADRAAQGDASDLIRAITKMMRDPEGQKLVEKMKQSLK